MLVLQTSVKRGHLSTMMGSLLKMIVPAATHALLINFTNGSVIIYRWQVNTSIIAVKPVQLGVSTNTNTDRQRRAKVGGKQ